MERGIAHTVKGGEHVFSFAKGNRTDAEIPSILDRVELKLKKDKFCRFKIDLSENFLTDEGVETLLNWLIATKCGYCVDLKLHKNEIGDSGASSISKFLLHSKNSLEALHLSHNRIGLNGVMDILYAVADAKVNGEYVYPRTDYNNEHHLPLWLRLEKNDASIPESKLEEWKEHIIQKRNCSSMYQPVCYPSKLCRPHKCEKGRSALSPLCHLKINRAVSRTFMDRKSAQPTKYSPYGEKMVAPQAAASGSDSSSKDESLDNNASVAPLNSSNTRLNHEPKLAGTSNAAEAAITDEPSASPQSLSADGLDSSVYENMPFYILMDISALLEMLDLRNHNAVYPFSLPGLLALLKEHLIEYLKEDGSKDTTKSDDRERIVILVVKDVYKELNKLCTSRPLWKKKVEDAKEAFIKPLMEHGVIEFLENFDSFGLDILSDSALRIASELQLTEETIKTITFAYLWSQNLSLAEQRIRNGLHRAVNCIFLTANPSVTKFFNHIEGHSIAKHEEFTSERATLPCLTVEALNMLLCSAFPTLGYAVVQPGAHLRSNKPKSSSIASSPLLTASSLANVLDEYLHSKITPTHPPASHPTSMDINGSMENTSSAATAAENAPPLFHPHQFYADNDRTESATDRPTSLPDYPYQPSYEMEGAPPFPSSLLGVLPDMRWNQQPSSRGSVNRVPVGNGAPTHGGPHNNYNFGSAVGNYGHPIVNTTTQESYAPLPKAPLFVETGKIAMEQDDVSIHTQLVDPSILAMAASQGETAASQSKRNPVADRYRSELIGAISIVEELSNRLRLGAGDGALYADDCLHRARAHIQRWSSLLALSLPNDI